MKLGDELANYKLLDDQALIQAFNRVDRADFVQPMDKRHAYIGWPMRIGHGQTISAAEVVAMMLEWLEVKPGHSVLDIGSGSGWTTTLLADVVGSKGSVLGLELIPELVSFGQDNLAKFDYPQAKIEQATAGILGTVDKTKFDRVLVSASTKEEWLEELLEQVKLGGKLVVPVRRQWTSYEVDDIYEITKDRERTTEVHPGFIFVPLIK